MNECKVLQNYPFFYQVYKIILVNSRNVVNHCHNSQIS